MSRSALIKRAREAIDAGLYGRARDLLTTELPRISDAALRIEALLLLARALERRNEPEEEYRVLSDALSDTAAAERLIGPASRDLLARGWVSLGLHLLNRGEHARAEGLFRRVLEDAGPADREARGVAAKNLAWILYENERYEEAAPVCEGALEDLRASGYAVHDTLVALADSLHQLGRHDEAERYLRQAIALEPPAKDMAGMFTVLASVLNRTGREELAHDYIREARYFLGIAAQEQKLALSNAIATVAWNAKDLDTTVELCESVMRGTRDKQEFTEASRLLLNTLYHRADYEACLRRCETILSEHSHRGGDEAQAMRLAVWSAAFLQRWSDVERLLEEREKRDLPGRDPELDEWVKERSPSVWRELLKKLPFGRT